MKHIIPNLLGIGWVTLSSLAQAGPTTQVSNVNVVNTPSVNVANTPGVNVLNTPIMQDRDNSARQPFTFLGHITIPDGRGDGSVQFSVPAGKRLVVEQAAVEGLGVSNPTLSVRIDTQFQGNTTSYSFTGAAAIQGHSLAGAQMRSYGDAQSTVLVAIYRDNTTGFEDINASLSGYLIDLP
jgi:hypothetical protein